MKKMLKFLRLATPVLVCAGVTVGADIALIEEIVAKVNGDIVTRGELSRSRRQMEAAIQGEVRSNNMTATVARQTLTEREKDILRDRIDTLLLTQKGKELNVNVDQDWSKYQADLMRRMKISDPEKFQQLVKDETGMVFEDFRSDWKNEQIKQRVVREQVGRTVNIPREEIRKYYEDHKTEFVRQERVFLRQILVSTDGKDEAGIAAAEKKAKDLVARARKGERFPELARDNSDAPTAQQGGDMGPWEKAKLREDIEKMVWDKPRNFVTDPIRVTEGFLILKVDEHQQAGQAAIEDVENEIMEKFYGERFMPAVREYLTKLRSEAFLEIKSGFVDTGAAPGKDTSWSDPAQLRPETITKEEVANQTRRRRLLWMVPIPGTKTTKSKPSSSR